MKASHSARVYHWVLLGRVLRVADRDSLAGDGHRHTSGDDAARVTVAGLHELAVLDLETRHDNPPETSNEKW